MTAHSHYRQDVKPVDEPLYVVTMLENPLRWRSRYWNYGQFAHEIEKSGAKLYTAEVAFGHRPFEITEAGRKDHLQLRTHDELWHKENALNLLIERLPADAKYIAWIDADVQFSRPDWAQETVEALQHYKFVQPFSEAQDMGPNYSIGQMHAYSFCYCYVEDIPPAPNPGPLAATNAYDNPTGVYWHPGFAWAARKDALDAVGMLMDFPIFGSADWHMACALIGEAEKSITASYTDTYKAWVREWQRRAEQNIKRNIGYVPGLVLHHYHGAKSNRGYHTRYKLMQTFDPLHDIKRDHQGLWQLDPDNSELRDTLRRYNRSRREDD